MWIKTNINKSLPQPEKLVLAVLQIDGERFIGMLRYEKHLDKWSSTRANFKGCLYDTELVTHYQDLPELP